MTNFNIVSNMIRAVNEYKAKINIFSVKGASFSLCAISNEWYITASVALDKATEKLSYVINISCHG